MNRLLTIVTILFCLTSNVVWSGEIENKWTVDIHKDLKMVIASVNGLKTHGDRLTIQFYKKNKCVTGNAAITLDALSKEISFVAEETEGYIGLDFHGKPIIHPRGMTDKDYLILPYGISASDIKNRFKNQYSGRFIII